jgi:hypothetical protein
MTDTKIAAEQLFWHCLHCHGHEPVEPTGGDDQYVAGDKEKCIDCGDGTAYVMPIKMAAAYEQGRALGLNRADAWERAQRVGVKR